MAVMYITEFASAGRARNNLLQLANCGDIVAQQAVTFTTSTASSAFNARTEYVRIYLSAAGHIDFGASPTATTSELPMAATTPEYFAVVAGEKVAAVTA